jgi:hypothetical protein
MGVALNSKSLEINCWEEYGQRETATTNTTKTTEEAEEGSTNLERVIVQLLKSLTNRLRDFIQPMIQDCRRVKGARRRER